MDKNMKPDTTKNGSINFLKYAKYGCIFRLLHYSEN